MHTKHTCDYFSEAFYWCNLTVLLVCFTICITLILFLLLIVNFIRHGVNFIRKVCQLFLFFIVLLYIMNR